MVKELVKVSVGQVPALKPLASAVYKRQRKQQTGLSRGIGLPQRSNSRLSATSVANRSETEGRLATKKSSHKSVPNRLQALHRCTKRMRCTSSRAAFQPLQPSDLLSNQNTQATKDVQGQPGHSWGLAQEAQYFAELDAEQLVEDGQEAAEVPLRRQPAVRGRTVAGQSQESKPKQKCDAEDFSSHIQTPNAVALAKYHPDLQAEYMEYVRCIGSSQSALTPMLLEDFCRLVGKEARGLPVFNT